MTNIDAWTSHIHTHTQKFQTHGNLPPGTSRSSGRVTLELCMPPATYCSHKRAKSWPLPRGCRTTGLGSLGAEWLRRSIWLDIWLNYTNLVSEESEFRRYMDCLRMVKNTYFLSIHENMNKICPFHGVEIIVPIQWSFWAVGFVFSNHQPDEGALQCFPWNTIHQVATARFLWKALTRMVGTHQQFW